jgi:type IV pilus assembly protein PilW
MKTLPYGLSTQRGFSLVELMVAMTLSLVLLAGALSILYSSKVTYAENDRIARLQEAGRTVVELILRDARAAGYRGCSRPLSASSFTNALAGSTDLLWNMGRPMNGFDGAANGSWAPGFDAAVIPDAAPGSDIVVLRTVREGTPSFELDAPVTDPTAPVTVRHAAGASVEAGDTLILNDCEGASVFAVTGFASAGTTATITHAAGDGPGENANTSIGRGFQLSGRLAMIDTVIYYVSETDTGPALWRKVGNDDPVALIEGVENLQVQYGVDTDGDLLADSYVNAATVDAANNWDNVISLTMAVLVRTETETNSDRDLRTYTMLDETRGPFNDRRQRSLFITTVTLRNRTT